MGTPRRSSEGSINLPTARLLVHVPAFGHEPLSLLTEHPAHPLLGGKRGIVRNARGFRRLADGLPKDGDVPENLPRSLIDTSLDGVLNLFGQVEQSRAFRRRTLVGLNATQRASCTSDAAGWSSSDSTASAFFFRSRSIGPRLAQPAEPTAKRLPWVVAEGCAFAAPGRSRPAGKALLWSRRRADIGGKIAGSPDRSA